MDPYTWLAFFAMSSDLLSLWSGRWGHRARRVSLTLGRGLNDLSLRGVLHATHLKHSCSADKLRALTLPARDQENTQENSSVAEYLPSAPKALGTVPSTAED